MCNWIAPKQMVQSRLEGAWRGVEAQRGRIVAHVVTKVSCYAGDRMQSRFSFGNHQPPPALRVEGQASTALVTALPLVAALDPWGCDDPTLGVLATARADCCWLRQAGSRRQPAGQ